MHYSHLGVGGKKWTFPHPRFRLSQSGVSSRISACLLSWFWHRWSLEPTAGEPVGSRDHAGVALRCSTEPDVGMLCVGTWNSDGSCGYSASPFPRHLLPRGYIPCRWKGSLETRSQKPWQHGAQGSGLGMEEGVHVIWLNEWNQPWALEREGSSQRLPPSLNPHPTCSALPAGVLVTMLFLLFFGSHTC